MDKVTNKEILEWTGLPSMEDLLIRKNLRWIGHLMRMSPDRLQKQILYSQLSSGHRKRGRPRLRFKDTIKRDLKLRDIKTDSWTSHSHSREINGEQWSSDVSILCHIATDRMMMMMMILDTKDSFTFLGKVVEGIEFTVDKDEHR